MIKRYSNFILELNRDVQLRLDYLLDNISKGKSVSVEDQEFLDSFAKNKENETHEMQLKNVKQETYEQGAFRFKIEEWEQYESDNMVYGWLTVETNKTEEFYGKIVLNEAGQVSYYLFNPTGSPSIEPTDEDYLDEVLDDFGLEVQFYEFVEYITKNEL